MKPPPVPDPSGKVLPGALLAVAAGLLFAQCKKRRRR